MKPSLGLRHSQQLALTPQLQQSIRLLQMSTAELEQEVDRFLAENPLLEQEDGPRELVQTGDRHPQIQDPQAAGARFDGPSASSAPEATNDSSRDDFPASDPWPSSAPRGGDDDFDWASQQAVPTQLQDHLREQMLGLSLSPRDQLWLGILIDSLDDDGYLRDELHEIEASVADLFEETFGERLDDDEQLLGLTLLQSMTPTGVGARNLQECLGLQLAELEKRLPEGQQGDGDRTRDAALRLTQTLVKNPSLLDLLGSRDFQSICKQVGCDRTALKEAIDLLQSLNPKPGDGFQDNTAGIVIPDVIAYRAAQGAGSHWQVRLNESAVPRLTINPMYAEMIRHDRASSMTSQLQEARWVIKNIQQRFDTILRVAQAIALEQQAFFEKGELAMRPLVLREIAERCGLHESTVSRVTTHKYMLTPKGTFELKYFFASHVSTDDGGTASSTAIRAKIRQWIADENPKKPLSDQQLADRFNEEGVRVARRTIAKYREALRIEPVSQRKKL